MLDALIEGISLVGGIGSIMGGSVFMVHRIEKGKTERVAMTEGTKQKAFDAAYRAEENRGLELALKASDANMLSPPAPDPNKIGWDLPGDMNVSARHDTGQRYGR